MLKKIKGCVPGDYIRFPDGYLPGEFVVREFACDRVLIERLHGDYSVHWLVPFTRCCEVIPTEVF